MYVYSTYIAIKHDNINMCFINYNCIFCHCVNGYNRTRVFMTTDLGRVPSFKSQDTNTYKVQLFFKNLYLFKSRGRVVVRQLNCSTAARPSRFYFTKLQWAFK